MIQDIYPHRLRNEFKDSTTPAPKDRIMIFEGSDLLVSTEGAETYPVYAALITAGKDEFFTYRYLFRIDEQEYYLGTRKAEQPERVEVAGYTYESIQILRRMESMELAYAGTTARHLALWYSNNHFCGRCGGELEHDHQERMLRCPKCGNMIFPRISPSVIVAVTDGDRILCTKYNRGRNEYQKYALVAGFTEIGETVEETVAREVMEEAGIKVKNIRYYKSQPWGFTGGLLLGYWAELDGDDTIHLDEEELAEGTWLNRKDLPLDSSKIALTREMMKQFKEGKERA